MFRRISWDKAGLAAASGASVVFAFVPFHIVPLIFLFPVLFTLLTLRCRSFKEGFAYGFITSFVVNAGGFYWVTYVIHEFGFMPWPLAGLIFLIFCGFGALYLPLFSGIASALHVKAPPAKMAPRFAALWFTLALPAWFLIPEYLIPKLFPFYTGHAFYWLPVTTQISEVTGSIFLSFALYSVGGALTLAWLAKRRVLRFSPIAAVVPVAIWATILGFGAQRLSEPEPEGKDLNIALIQANIGSLDKFKARQGVRSKIRLVLDRYFALTELALQRTPRPELVVWPETAMPVQLDGPSPFAQEIRERPGKWGVPLITGAYASHETDYRRDYNAAFLLEPPESGSTTPLMQIYRKNILLAFGEYFPGGESFPILYRYFPQVSNFARGTSQEPFVLRDGTRLGCTVCYEAIVPSFYRKIILNGVNGVVNLTNDSWFGPTTEPRHHGALASFRTVETRAPLIRVTNTGISFVVDTKGRMSETTGVYEEGVLVTKVRLPRDTVTTFYSRHGDWIILVAAAMALGFSALALRRRDDAPVPL